MLVGQDEQNVQQQEPRSDEVDCLQLCKTERKQAGVIRKETSMVLQRFPQDAG